jgi:hypothetical protein
MNDRIDLPPAPPPTSDTQIHGQRRLGHEISGAAGDQNRRGWGAAIKHARGAAALPIIWNVFGDELIKSRRKGGLVISVEWGVDRVTNAVSEGGSHCALVSRLNLRAVSVIWARWEEGKAFPKAREIEIASGGRNSRGGLAQRLAGLHCMSSSDSCGGMADSCEHCSLNRGAIRVVWRVCTGGARPIRV